MRHSQHRFAFRRSIQLVAGATCVLFAVRWSEAAELWSLAPIHKPAAPAVQDKTWARGTIDEFVLARLEAAGLEPSPPADRRTLLRRVYFDLLGLPPTVAQIESFENDDDPEAYARIVDALLTRPEYGERWARHWLDVARYADTTGYLEGAETRYPFAYTYRDYVVRSLNDDTPFDRFVVEQLAADQLDLTTDERWKLAAMGFLTVGQRFNYNRHEVIADRIDVVSRGLIGLSVGCARCHDHKYDPISMDDYYSLYGVFASSYEPIAADLPRIATNPRSFSRYRAFRREAGRRAAALHRFLKSRHTDVQHELRAFATDYLRYCVEQMPEHRTRTQVSFDTERTHLRGPTPYGPGAIVRWQRMIEWRGPDDPVFGLWNRLARLSRDDFASRAGEILANAAGTNPRVREALIQAQPQSMIDVASVYGRLLEDVYASWRELSSGKASVAALPDRPSEELRQVLYGDDSPAGVNIDEARELYTDGEFNRYMGMKRELEGVFFEFGDAVSPRAMVLRDRPELYKPRVHERGISTQPGRSVPRRFLRALAHVDDESGYAARSGRLALARAIVHAENPLTPRVVVNRVWRWHFGRGLVESPSDFGSRGQRPSHPKLLDHLAAAFVEHGWSLKRLHRAILLSATYQQASLDRPEGVKADPDNTLLWRMNRRRLGFEAMRDAMLAVAGHLDTQPGGPPQRELLSPRRTLHLTVERGDPRDVLRAFDVPSPDLSCSRRSETTVPQQGLFLLNNDFAKQASAMAAARVEALGPADHADRIVKTFEQILGRAPSDDEFALARAFLGNAVTEPRSRRWRDFTQALMASNEFAFVD